jgi:hypothetical protein
MLLVGGEDTAQGRLPNRQKFEIFQLLLKAFV